MGPYRPASACGSHAGDPGAPGLSGVGGGTLTCPHRMAARLLWRQRDNVVKRYQTLARLPDAGQNEWGWGSHWPRSKRLSLAAYRHVAGTEAPSPEGATDTTSGLETMQTVWVSSGC